MAEATLGGQVKTKVSEALVRVGRCSLENLTKGLLTLFQNGKKLDLPHISDILLLESATTLAEKIRKGEVSSVSVVRAYIQRISEVNIVVNAVVDRRCSQALEEAARVDELVKSGTKTLEEMELETPLLGIPFSSKEACLVKGLSSTCGLVCRKGLVANEDCGAVAQLRQAGAIPLAVTNTSEICMWWETYNKLYGQTLNPYDSTKTVGGSSGGEAALIASAGSLIGLGTDLGGSIRFPSFLTGIFGHKPSSGLVPHSGQFPPALAEISPYVVTGPMARYAKDLRLITKVLAGKDAASRIELDAKVELQNIKVYYMLDDGGLPAMTPVDAELRAAMQKVLGWLKNRKAQVKEVNIRNLKYGFMIWCACLSRVKDQRISGLMAGDVKPTESKDSLHQEMWRWLSGRSEHTFPIILNACIQDHIAPLLKRPLDIFYKKGISLKKEMDEILRGDAVFLYPSFPTPAQPHGQMLVTPMNVGYTVVFNALGLPVTQCPLGLNESGLPIGMQIVTAHEMDRVSLSLAEEIEQTFGGWIRP